ncbi:DUF6603 domain-containing protein [Fibrobacter sp. UWB11]|uniref:DUF6603 domain-containing protein n=1 Tax=Fibrobacter sp. UWB11 TaxID=1896202 RepID=UPI00092B18EE|nr:DUF6603 domain-containing protein [Fibrobacter sp. UWB11]SIN96294.1 hypothetical protein SAMN05720758_0775 [Fibrobacter sp. UWB11]
MDILVKLGQVFTRIGDAAFKDFTEFCLGKDATWDDFKKQLDDKGIDAFEKFVNQIFQNIGYDISNCTSSELYKQIESLITKSMELGNYIKDLVDNGDVKSIIGGLVVSADDKSDSNDIVSLDDYLKKMECSSYLQKIGLPENTGVKIGGPIKELLDIVMGIVEAIKEIADFEWNKLADDCNEFGEFLKNKYYNEDFGRRILDYILILLLKNARDVFADDVKYLIKKHSDMLRGFIADKFGDDTANSVMDEIDGYINSITIIEDTIKDLEKDSADRAEKAKNKEAESSKAAVAKRALRKAAKSAPVLENSASDTAEEVSPNSDESTSSEESAKEPSVQLQSALNVCKDKLNTLLEKYVPSYNMVAKIFDRTYAILNLCGIITEETVNLIEVDEVKDANSAIKDKVSVDLIDLASDKVGTSIQIPVFHWDRLEKMFTAPKDYLKEAFPLDSTEDVEKLAAKIATVIRSFDSDFPEFKNIKQFVLDLINRIDARLEGKIDELKNEIKEKLTKFKEFLVELVKILERYAYEVKNALEIAFNNFKNGRDSLISELETNAKKLIEKAKIFKFSDQVPSKYADGVSVLESIFLDTFKDAAETAVLKKYSGVSVEEALHADFNALTAPFGACKGNLEKLAEKIRDDFKETFNGEKWKTLFGELVSDLEKEFNKQTKDVPKTLDELKKFACESLVDIVNNEGIKNPLSNFDPSAYFKIIGDYFSEKFKDAIKLDPETYIADFKKYVREFFNGFFEGLKKNIEGISELGDDIQILATDIWTAWLENIKQKIYELIVRPYIQQAKKAVKNWGKSVITTAINDAKKTNALVLDSATKNGYKEFFKSEDNEAKSEAAAANSNSANQIADVVAESATFALDLLDLIEEAKDIDSWTDGIKFAVNLYKAIPHSVKKYVTELIDLPNIDFSNIHLPEYTLDTENKFFAVTLWQYNYDDKGRVKQNADVSIRLAFFVSEDKNGVEGLYICPILKGKYDAAFNIGKNHHMKIGVSASVGRDSDALDEKDEERQCNLANGNIGFFIHKPSGKRGIEITPVGDKSALEAYLELWFKRGAVDEDHPNPAELIKSKVVDLTIGNYPQKIFAGYKNGAFDVGFVSRLEDLQLMLKLKELNGFFDAVLSDNVKITLDKLAVGYSLQDGLKIEEGLHVKIPFNSNIDLKVVKFKNLSLDLGLEDGDFEANLLTTFVADLKCVAFTFTDLGFGIKCNLFTTDGKAGTLKLNPSIKYPTGIGINIDASAVKGGGLIQWDEKKQRFAGALELDVLEKFGVNAMLIFTTGKGTDPFSFMGAISVKFNPGIQVGMGFSITAVGGSLGLNRALDVDNLRNAVYDGSLSSVLFVKDVMKDFDKVLANVDKYYPITEEQMYFGLLAQITWGTILSADFGLFIQAPSPVTVIVAGLIKVRLADSAEKLLAINANFLGGIQFDKGIFFDASLFDSKIVGISIYGDMALRIYWGGATKGFILSIGGFHPQYKPESGFNLVDMKRVGMKLDFGPVNMSLEAYFAITSNTVQFGSAFNMKIGWDNFGLTGHAIFNILFQFNPFYFMADLSIGIAVKLFSATLCSISLDFDLSGPAKWHAKGEAKICVLLFDVKVHFDCTWGKDQNTIELAPIDVFPIFEKEYLEKNNWKIISTDLTDNLVTLIPCEMGALVAQPNDVISFSQSKVPLGKWMDCYGENRVNDCTKIDLVEIQIDSDKIIFHSDESRCVFENDSFAPSLTHKMTDDEKLDAESYRNEISGFRLSADFGYDDSKIKKRDVAEGEFIDASFDSKEKEDKKNVDSYIELWGNYSKASESAGKQTLVKKTIATKSLKPKAESAEVLSGLKRRSRKPAIGNADCFNIANRMTVAQNSEQKQKKLMSRSSLRRSATGLKRYVKQIDELIAANALTIPENVSNNITSTGNANENNSIEFNPVQYKYVVDSIVLNAPKLSIDEKLNFDYTVKNGAATVEWVTYVRLSDNKYFINNQNTTSTSFGEKYRVHVYLYPRNNYAFKMENGNADCNVKLSDGTVLKSDGLMTANGKYCCHFYYDVELPSQDHIRFLSLTNKASCSAKLKVFYKKTTSSTWETYESGNISKDKAVTCDLVSELKLPLNTLVQPAVVTKSLLLFTRTKKANNVFRVHPEVNRKAEFTCEGSSVTPKIQLKSIS